MPLRAAVKVSATWQRPYFHQGHAYYPYYVPTYDSRSDFVSPFGFYFGVCDPFISRSDSFVRRPNNIYIEIPVYSGDEWRAYSDRREDNYLEHADLGETEPGLLNALDELHEAFSAGNIDSLVALTDPRTEIAIFLRGVVSRIWWKRGACFPRTS